MFFPHVEPTLFNLMFHLRKSGVPSIKKEPAQCKMLECGENYKLKKLGFIIIMSTIT